MKLAYQTENQIAFSVCQHGFVVLPLRIQCIKHSLHVSIIQIGHHIDVYYCSCFRRYMTVNMYEIIIERTLNTIGQCICWLSV